MLKVTKNGEDITHLTLGEKAAFLVPPPKPIVPVRPIQAEPWPIVLLPLKLLAKPLDRGAGDIIARVIGPIGGDAFKKWYKRIFGKDCGCGTRQGELNQRWPLGSENLCKSA